MEERRLIPGTLGYTVDREGNVYDEYNNKKPVKKSNSGYISVLIKNAHGALVNTVQHKCLALAFIPKDRPDRDFVNHRDGLKDNNVLSNLEWVTNYENQIHIEALTSKSVRPSIIIFKEMLPIGTAINLFDAQEKSGVHYLKIWDSIKDRTITDNGFSFEYLTRNIKPPKELRTYKENTGIMKSVKIKDTETGEIKFFKSIREAADHHDTVPSGVYQAIFDSGHLKLLQRRYLVTYQDRDFPVIDPAELMAARTRGAKEVYAHNMETNKSYIYASAGSFVRASGLNRNKVTNALVKEKLKILVPWAFIYDSEENRKILNDYVLGPAEA